MDTHQFASTYDEHDEGRSSTSTTAAPTIIGIVVAVVVVVALTVTVLLLMHHGGPIVEVTDVDLVNPRQNPSQVVKPPVAAPSSKSGGDKSVTAIVRQDRPNAFGEAAIHRTSDLMPKTSLQEMQEMSKLNVASEDLQEILLDVNDHEHLSQLIKDTEAQLTDVQQELASLKKIQAELPELEKEVKSMKQKEREIADAREHVENAFMQDVTDYEGDFIPIPAKGASTTSSKAASTTTKDISKTTSHTRLKQKIDKIKSIASGTKLAEKILSGSGASNGGTALEVSDNQSASKKGSKLKRMKTQDSVMQPQYAASPEVAKQREITKRIARV